MLEYTAEQAYALWQGNEAIIVDIREQLEHDHSRVAGISLIPMSELQDREDELPTELPLIILCRSGNRSAMVADYLTGIGDWGEVANLTGGIIGWAAAGLPYEGQPPT